MNPLLLRENEVACGMDIQITVDVLIHIDKRRLGCYSRAQASCSGGVVEGREIGCKRKGSNCEESDAKYDIELLLSNLVLVSGHRTLVARIGSGASRPVGATLC